MLLAARCQGTRTSWAGNVRARPGAVFQNRRRHGRSNGFLRPLAQGTWGARVEQPGAPGCYAGQEPATQNLPQRSLQWCVTPQRWRGRAMPRPQATACPCPHLYLQEKSRKACPRASSTASPVAGKICRARGHVTSSKFRAGQRYPQRKQWRPRTIHDGLPTGLAKKRPDQARPCGSAEPAGATTLSDGRGR